jgi:hypothetical protein
MGKRGNWGKGKREHKDYLLPLYPFSHFPFLSRWSPLHRALFGCVDLGLVRHWQRLAEEKTLDVIEEKVLRVRVSKIQTVVIDDLGLLLEPPSPARLTDVSGDSLSKLVRKRRKANRRPLFAAVFAFNILGHY